MNLKQQVSSLAPSRRLRELGVKQESYFRWCVEVFSGDSFEHNKTHPELHVPLNEQQIAKNKAMIPVCAALTVAELGEMLSKASAWDFHKAYTEVMGLAAGQFSASLAMHNVMTQPDIAAKMLIYLIENKLITV